MKEIYYSYPKINLFLKIGNKINNLHNIKSLMLYIDTLRDIFVVKKSKKFKFTCTKKIKNNIVLKIYNYFLNKYKIKLNYNIKLIKKIPIASGLGGESSNAAFMINFINNKCLLNLNLDELINISKLFGSDIIFFLTKGNKYIYENFNYFIYNDKIYHPTLLIYKKKNITKNMFYLFDKDQEVDFKNYNSINDNLIKNINFNKLLEIGNDFLKYNIKDNLFNFSYNKIKEKNNIYLTGSGPTLFSFDKLNKKNIKKIKGFKIYE